MKKVLAFWAGLPAPVKSWLKGLEVFVLTGVVTAALAFPEADFSSKTGIAKFAGTILAAAGACVRLYLTQSPVQKVIAEVEASRTVSPAGTVKTTVSETITK
jgi:hypothetical protein